MALQQLTGVLKEIGDGTYALQANATGRQFTKLSYIEVGDEIVRDLQVLTGVKGKLHGSLGHEVTLFIAKRTMVRNTLVGITTADGRTFASPNYGKAWKTGFWILLILGILLLPALGLGILFIVVAFLLRPSYLIYEDAKKVPNAIIV